MVDRSVGALGGLWKPQVWREWGGLGGELGEQTTSPQNSV